jgi:hypothetical protein
MATELGAVHPTQDLINRVIELQHRLENFKPLLGKYVELKVEYNNTAKKVDDARTAVMALVAEFDHVPRDDRVLGA